MKFIKNLKKTWNDYETLKKIFKIVLSPFIFLAVGNLIMQGANNFVPKKENTAVFVANYGGSFYEPNIPIFSHIQSFFMLPQIMLRENLRGRHVDRFTNASYRTIENKLKSDKYQNVVFIGHGKEGTYCAADGCMDSHNFSELKIPKLSGEMIKYTCGSNPYHYVLPLENVLLKDPKKTFKFKKKVSQAEGILFSVYNVFRNPK